jgi:hypothetical protein
MRDRAAGDVVRATRTVFGHHAQSIVEVVRAHHALQIKRNRSRTGRARHDELANAVQIPPVCRQQWAVTAAACGFY